MGPGTRVLDLACGKGEMLCRWAEWFGSGGVGVDLSHVFLAAARERASELGVADRVSFVQGDAGAYEAAPGAFDIAQLPRRDVDRRRAGRDAGAPAAGGARRRPGHRGRAVLASRSRRPRRWQAWGFGPDDYASLAGTAERLDAAGFELLEMVLADGDSWDRYEASQWRTVADWLARQPGRPGPRGDAPVPR